MRESFRAKKSFLSAFCAFLWIWPSWLLADSVAVVDASSAGINRGAVMLVHGLNTPIERFDDLVALVNSRGFSAIRPILSGHEENSFYDASLEQWDSQLLLAYDKAHELAGGGAIYCLGFSLGGALCTRFAKIHPELRLDGLILLAPALKLKWYLWAGRAITPLKVLGVALPGISPKDYKKLPSLSLYTYGALYSLCGSFDNDGGFADLDKIRTTLFIREEDELVSFDREKEWLSDNRLGSWRLVVLPKNPEPHAYQHLVIDRNTLGEEGWKIESEAIGEMLGS